MSLPNIGEYPWKTTVANDLLERVAELEAELMKALGENTRLAVLRLNAVDERDEARELLRAVTCTQFGGPVCDDVNGSNWFDARDELLKVKGGE